MRSQSYSSFAQACCSELQTLQDKFLREYNINDYDSWFYNQATGLLTFSKNEEEVNFRYLQVGTYSTATQTWKWSWDNESTLNSVKDRIHEITDFGAANNYEKLTTGYFKSSEEDAWEFAAIAAKITKGIGVYRPVADHLLVFMVVLEFVENYRAKNIKDLYVKCEEHEYRRRAFVCQHLSQTTKVGFEEAFETYENMELSDDDDLQAWCDECEKVRQNEGEWNEVSMTFAGIKVVCEKCYFEMKELNLKRSIPPHLNQST